jgi:hypothetical protein
MINVPKIVSGWKPLFKPEKYGSYVNGHTIIKDKENNWHMFGITSHNGGSENERYFVHAKSDALYSEYHISRDANELQYHTNLILNIDIRIN